MAKVSIKFNNKQPLNESVYEKTPCEDKKIIDVIFAFLVDMKMPKAFSMPGGDDTLDLVFRPNELPKKIEDITNVVSKKIRSDKRLCTKNLNLMIVDKILKYLQDEKNEISPYCREQLRNQMEELDIIKAICGDTSSFEDFEEPTAEPETVTQPTQSAADKEEEEDDIETRKRRVQPPLKPKKTRRVKTKKAGVKTKKATVASDSEEKNTDSGTETPVEPPQPKKASSTKGTTGAFRRSK
jgi:hypothetical protein